MNSLDFYCFFVIFPTVSDPSADSGFRGRGPTFEGGCVRLRPSNQTLNLLIKVVVLLVTAVQSSVLVGQSSETISTDSETVLDPSPFATARAASMGGALSTLADDLDALYYNPAGIGGLGFDGKSEKRPFVKALYFPYFGSSLNENASSVQKKFQAEGAQNDASAGAAVMDANAGKRQFARVSVLPLGLLLGRTAIVPVIDHQLAAVPVINSPGDVKMRYRTFSGAMIGTSIADNQNRFSLGVSQSIGTIQETYGTYKYVDMVDVDQRKEILSQSRKTYAAKGLNAGMTIRIPKSATPSFSIVARNVGNTKNTAKSDGTDPLIYNEDLTAGFSISPPLGKFGRFNLLLESGYLTQKHMAAKKKARGGVEFLFGGDDSKALFGLRAGGNDAGGSFGASLNLGLIGLEAETHAIDIGINNERLIERRSSGVLYINVASF